MITSTFEPMLDENSNVIGKRLTIYYNNKFVSQTDFPAESEMDADQRDNYIASKLSAVLS